MPRDFPPGTEEMWDITAKALMIRAGGHVHISPQELRQAAETPALILLNPDGSLLFKIEGH